jgi:hypothetical protein
LSRNPPANVHATAQEGSVLVEWEVDSFFPDPEPPHHIIVELGAGGPNKGLDGDERSVELTAEELTPFAGTTVVVNVGFQWDGGVPLWSTIDFSIPARGEGPVFRPPVPSGKPAPGSLRFFWDSNRLFVLLQWENPISYDKILVRWGLKDGGAIQFDRGGGATNADCGPIHPNRTYVFMVKGGTTAGLLGGYNYSDWSSVEWNSPDGPEPMPAEGVFPQRSRIAVTARRPDRLQLFGTGGDGIVRTSWWHEDEPWAASTSGWRWPGLGGFFPAGAPVTGIARHPDHLDLFITGNDGRVYTSWWHEGQPWSGVDNNWRSIGGIFPPGAPIAVTSRHAGNLDLFITGNDGRVYTSWWYDGHDWSGVNDSWAGIGGFFPAGAPVTAVARRPDHLDLFITGNNRIVYTSWWHDGHAWSGVRDNWVALGG